MENLIKMGDKNKFQNRLNGLSDGLNEHHKAIWSIPFRNIPFIYKGEGMAIFKVHLNNKGIKKLRNFGDWPGINVVPDKKLKDHLIVGEKYLAKEGTISKLEGFQKAHFFIDYEEKYFGALRDFGDVKKRSEPMKGPIELVYFENKPLFHIDSKTREITSKSSGIEVRLNLDQLGELNSGKRYLLRGIITQYEDSNFAILTIYEKEKLEDNFEKFPEKTQSLVT